MSTLPPVSKLLPPFLLTLLAFPSTAHAMCTQSIMPIFQCGFVGWFAPPPSGAGTVSTVWWQLGYGNNNVNNGATTTPANEGTGIAPAGVFSGNDSGLSAPYARLTLADVVLPQYAAQIPDGSLCMNYEFSWAGAGVDGCADNPRTTNAFDNDNLLNPYFGGVYGTDYYTTWYQIDYPIAVMARESSNKFFALAMVTSRSRAADPVDISEGLFDLSQVANGDPNPVTGKTNIIPWQPVPKVLLELVATNPQNPANRDITVSWNPIRLVHDGSSRMNGRLSPRSEGVGVLDQMSSAGGICRYQLQMAPLAFPGTDPATLAWSNVGSPIPCPNTSSGIRRSLTVPGDSALRVRTILGKTPVTFSVTLANCRTGLCGDLGFEATACRADNCVDSPPLTFIPGPLVSEQAVDTVAERNRNAVVVRFRTTSELTVTGIDILGKLEAVVASVPCKECTSGVGADYEVVLTPGDLKGARTLRVRLNGPGAVSPPFPVP
jgi:hypothetical protein